MKVSIKFVLQYTPGQYVQLHFVFSSTFCFGLGTSYPCTLAFDPLKIEKIRAPLILTFFHPSKFKLQHFRRDKGHLQYA